MHFSICVATLLMPITAGFFVICPIFGIAHAYMYLCAPCHVQDKTVEGCLHLSPLMHISVSLLEQ